MFDLPKGLPTIALNQEQIGHILPIVADETARASIVIGTSQSSIRDSPTAHKTQMHRPVSVQSCTTGSEEDLTSFGIADSGREAYSRGTTSEEEFWGKEEL